METSNLVTTIIIIGYLVFFTAIGFYLNRNNRSSKDWAIGGGTLGIGMLAAGLAGTRIGGAGTYGVAGDVMASGMGNLWYAVNSFAALAMVGLFFAIPYRRLRLTSIGQIFDMRFGARRSQWLTSLCVQTEYLVINIIEPYVIGSIVSGVTGIPFGIGVFIGAAVIIIFTVTGGLKGTAVTNIVHCGVIILGLGLVGIIAMQNLGGWDAMVTQADAALEVAGRDQASWWSFTGIGWASIIALFIAATIHTPAVSIYANYSSSAAREDYLIPAFLIGGIVAALMPLVAGFIGISTLANYGVDSGLSSYLNISQLAIDTGPVIGGIALAAVLAAVISSGIPLLLGASTMFVNDWIPGSKNYSSEKLLFSYKTVTVFYGLFAATIAWLGDISSVLQLLLLGFAMVVPPAIAVVYVFYWRRTTEKAAFWGIMSGYAAGLINWLLNTLFDGPENAAVGGFPQFWYELIQYLGEWRDPSFLALLLPVIVIPVMVYIDPDSKQQQESEQAKAFYGRLGRIQRNLQWR